MVINNSTNIISSSNLPIWKQPEIIRWSKILADSYHHILGENLLDWDTPEQLSHDLYHASFVVVSHGTQTDPIFNLCQSNRFATMVFKLG